MKKRRSVNDNLKEVEEIISTLLAAIKIAPEGVAESELPKLKMIGEFVRLRKAMLEMALLEEEWNERRRQRRGAGAKARKAGISAEALEEIGRLLGLDRPDDHAQTHQNN